MSLNKLNDEIIISFANGNKDAFVAVYNQYQQIVFNNIARLIPHTDVVEDVLQEVFLKLWENKHKFDDEHAVASWLFSVSYNQSISHIRKLIKERKYLESMKADVNFEYDPESEVEIENIKENILAEAINQLPLRKKQAFELCKLQGKTYAEAAEIMNISSETVKEHITLALKFVHTYTVNTYKKESAISLFIIGLYFHM
ncbi:RNA polymerase sigma-70 factor (ECF subfamily) [Flavobacterium sp. 90]|uniref:RNA polymerase sigma factor n=1 Tax=unclassified Flavobacterium TaxID=196869 RepID=UPI000EAE3986|nr:MULTISPECIES: sigma-70 family RNA polymerase sigma factor [unclassified Flavobacterium]RKR05047.1 RNA polymerase sigma-70 factor (ECF subfamily) [Flavobacterium sp. 81]TCK56363.1 RNA polymerase sigma-70 factor (ECF subfamily) [Flavobacterium sp. 90]